MRARRPTLAYFSGNLAQNEPLKYARGIRHRLMKAFYGAPGWTLIGKAGGYYSRDLSESIFCLVPPGGDGWSSRVDDAVRHGCIPVIIMDNVHMPFETSLNYSSFSIRVPEHDVEELDRILRSVSPHTQSEMRKAMRGIWTRFIYARSFLEAQSFLGTRLPHDHLESTPFKMLAAATSLGGADAFESIMFELVVRLNR